MSQSHTRPRVEMDLPAPGCLGSGPCSCCSHGLGHLAGVSSCVPFSPGLLWPSSYQSSCSSQKQCKEPLSCLYLSIPRHPLSPKACDSPCKPCCGTKTFQCTCWRFLAANAEPSHPSWPQAQAAQVTPDVVPLPANSKQPELQGPLHFARPPSKPCSPAVPFKGDGAQEGGRHLWVLWYKAKGVLRNGLCWRMVLTKTDLAPPAIKEPHRFQTVPAPEISAQS